jgi:phosphate:Na+ symporter
VFLHGESRDAERLIARKAVFREFEVAATTLSVRLLRGAATARSADSSAAERVAQETGLFLRMVRDLRRIHSHLASFAYPVLNRPEVSAPGR